MAIGKFRCIVMNVPDLERGDVSGRRLPGYHSDSVRSDFRHVSRGSAISRLIRFCSSSSPKVIRLRPINAHLDLTVEDVDVAVQQALALGATLRRKKGTYPLDSPSPYLEWAVMADPFGNAFCLIKDLV